MFAQDTCMMQQASVALMVQFYYFKSSWHLYRTVLQLQCILNNIASMPNYDRKGVQNTKIVKELPNVNNTPLLQTNFVFPAHRAVRVGLFTTISSILTSTRVLKSYRTHLIYVF